MEDNNVILVKLPSALTHVTQPCDLSDLYWLIKKHIKKMDCFKEASRNVPLTAAILNALGNHESENGFKLTLEKRQQYTRGVTMILAACQKYNTGDQIRKGYERYLIFSLLLLITGLGCYLSILPRFLVNVPSTCHLKISISVSVLLNRLHKL